MGFFDFVKDVVTSVGNAFIAPYAAVYDIARGENVLQSVKYRTLQAIPLHTGGIITQQAIAGSDSSKQLAATLNPYTFGLSGNIQEGMDYQARASRGEKLSDAEVNAAFRAYGTIGAVAGVGVALAPQGGYTLTHATLAAGGSKLLTTGDASGLIAAAGGALGADPSLVGTVAKYYGSPKTPPAPEIGAANFVPRIQLKTPQASVFVDQPQQSSSLLPLLIIGGAAVLLLATTRR